MTFGERFLTAPDLFPARLAGSPWGEGEVAVPLPAGAATIGGLAPGQEAWVRGRFAGMAPPDGPPPATVRVLRAGGGDFHPLDLTGEEYAFDLAAEERGVALAGPGFMARLDLESAAAALWVAGDREGYEFPSGLDNTLRVLLAYRLAAAGGALLHSAAVALAGGVWVFLGRSGSGKSTLGRAALAGGRELLSDDLNAVLDAPAGAVVEKVPFAGDLGQSDPAPRRGPLAGWVRLAKGPRLVARPLRPAEAFATLLACAPYVNRDRWREPALEANLARLLGGVPALELEVPRGVTIDEVEGALAAG